MLNPRVIASSTEYNSIIISVALFSITCIIIIMIAWWLIKREKCYENIGCFDDKAPFDNLSILGKKFLPDSPASVKPRFFLYTRETRNHAEELLPYNSDTVSKSKFDSKRKTIFIIHGFSSFSKDGRLMDMKSAFLSKVLLYRSVNKTNFNN